MSAHRGPNTRLRALVSATSFNGVEVIAKAGLGQGSLDRCGGDRAVSARHDRVLGVATRAVAEHGTEHFLPAKAASTLTLQDHRPGALGGDHPIPVTVEGARSNGCFRGGTRRHGLELAETAERIRAQPGVNSSRDRHVRGL
jgi:hypothetical protein